MRITRNFILYFMNNSNYFLHICLFVDYLHYISRNLNGKDSFEAVMLSKILQYEKCPLEASWGVRPCEQTLKVLLYFDGHFVVGACVGIRGQLLMAVQEIIDGFLLKVVMCEIAMVKWCNVPNIILAKKQLKKCKLNPMAG